MKLIAMHIAVLCAVQFLVFVGMTLQIWLRLRWENAQSQNQRTCHDELVLPTWPSSSLDPPVSQPIFFANHDCLVSRSPQTTPL